MSTKDKLYNKGTMPTDIEEQEAASIPVSKTVSYTNTDNYKKEITVGGIFYKVNGGEVITFPQIHEINFNHNKIGMWAKVIS